MHRRPAVTETTTNKSYGDTWRSRLSAMRNIPPVMRMVWECGPKTVIWSMALRVALALMPVAILEVSRWLINAIVMVRHQHTALPQFFWWIVVLEFTLASVAAFLSQGVGFCDSLLGELYLQHISVRVIEHASKLDITAFENPDFYDRLERAKAQATDRIAMIQMVGTLIQLVLTTISLSLLIAKYSPWLLLLLIAGTIPALLGESHFAFLGYAKNFMQTPLRRKMDYLRDVGGSKEAAKELKLFGLRDFLVSSFSGMANTIFDQNVDLSKRRLMAGSLLSLLATAGYYSAYALVLWGTIRGKFTVAGLAVLINAILQVSANLQQ